MKSYTATYKFETILGEPGWSYEVSDGRRVLFQGWSRGRSRTHAEREVREGINAREALRRAAGLAS